MYTASDSWEYYVICHLGDQQRPGLSAIHLIHHQLLSFNDDDLTIILV